MKIQRFYFSVPFASSILQLLLISGFAPAHPHEYKPYEYKPWEQQLFEKEQRSSVEPILDIKKKYFFGEAVIIKILFKNTGTLPVNTKEAECQKITVEMAGAFNNASGLERKQHTYDGSLDPSTLSRPAETGGVIEWVVPGKREPKYVKLVPGEATVIRFNLGEFFQSDLGLGVYRLIITTETGRKIYVEFEIYYDDVKSDPIIAGALRSQSDSRYWAIGNMVRTNRQKLVALLNDIVRSGDEKQRIYADETLHKIRSGWYDAIKLEVDGNDRFFIGQAPKMTVKIRNGGSVSKEVSKAELQKIAIEIAGPFEGNSQQERKIYVYDSGRAGSEAEAYVNLWDKTGAMLPQKMGASKSVKLSESDYISLLLDLSTCFHSRLRVGKYQLIAKGTDEQAIFKEQVIDKDFEVYFDLEKSTYLLSNMLNSTDSEWAVTNLAKYNRPKLLALLEEMAKSSDKERSRFAASTLEKIKSGFYDRN